MNKKISVFVLYLFFVIPLFSQQVLHNRDSYDENVHLNSSKNILLPDGEILRVKNNTQMFKAKVLTSKTNNNHLSFLSGTLDTLSYGYLGSFSINFGFKSQDVMMQYFEAPADMIIKAIGVDFSDVDEVNNSPISVRLVKLNWTNEQLRNVQPPKYIGYYPSAGDGFNNADYFGEEATGNWIDSTNGEFPLPPWANHVNPDSNSFDYDLWSDSGKGVIVQPVQVPFTDPETFQWVETGVLNNEPIIQKGEIFAVVVKHEGNLLEENRIGFWSSDEPQYYGWKYYENGRIAPEQPGWWVRRYTWNFAVSVDFIDEPCRIINVTNLLTTLSIEPRQVCATIDCGQNVDEVNLKYRVDFGEWNSVKMDSADVNTYCAEIPGQRPNSTVEYFVEVIEKDGTRWTSMTHIYTIFGPCTNTLVFFNGMDGEGFPENSYFGHDDFVTFTSLDFPHDVYANAPLTKEILAGFTNLFEFTTKGPEYYHKQLIEEWLNEDSTRNYFLAGQEWLVPSSSGYPEYQPSEFEYKILGVKKPYFDVSYDGYSGQEIPSKLIPVQGSLIGGALYDKFMENGPTDSLIYDPTDIIGVVDNWIDAFEPVDLNNVDLYVETRGLNGAPDVQVKACAVHNVTPNGNKIVFLTFDPLAIGSRPDYYWYGFSSSSPQVQALDWFGVITGIKNSALEMFEEFGLSQNYPNPFNPTTKIKYSLPNVGQPVKMSYNVTLKVYDVLGREVATLVNKKQSPGNYEITFNAKKLPSGIYFYQLKTANFIQTRKMVLMK